jgi:hypothetical protein
MKHHLSKSNCHCHYHCPVLLLLLHLQLVVSTHIHHHCPVQCHCNSEAVNHMVQLAAKAAVLPQVAQYLLGAAAVCWMLQVVERLKHSASDFFPHPGLRKPKTMQQVAVKPGQKDVLLICLKYRGGERWCMQGAVSLKDSRCSVH